MVNALDVLFVGLSCTGIKTANMPLTKEIRKVYSKPILYI